MGKSIINWIGIVVCLFLVALTIPVVLNEVLQWNVSDCIIGKQGDAPATWLAFWGTYLAAIGSLVMAWVSHRQNKEIQRQNAYKVKYDACQKNYDFFEKQLIENASLYSVQCFIDILNEYCKGGSYREMQCQLMFRLNQTSLYMPRYQNSADDTMKKYGQALCQFNETFFDISLNIKEIFEDQNEEEQDKEKLKEQVANKIENCISELNKKISIIENRYGKGLTNLGFDVLQNMQDYLGRLQSKIANP